MKRVWVLIAGMCWFGLSFSQEGEEINRSEIEFDTEPDANDSEDDSYFQLLDHFRKRPLNINTCAPEELTSLHLCNAFQIQSFFEYRRLLGSLISVYELQAVPGWNVGLIHKILPFITINNRVDKAAFRKRLREGDSQLMLRAVPWAENVDPTWEGGSSAIQLRYKYRYQNSLQWGVTAEKDAGEAFGPAGFDFYSFHFYAKDAGRLKAVAIGDYNVSLGQGLIQWQGYAVKKGPSVLAIKRQGVSLKPHTSSGEFNFHRGIALQWQQAGWKALGFLSARRIDSNVLWDSAGSPSAHVTAINSSGLHRSPNEISMRRNLSMLAGGGSMGYEFSAGEINLNWVAYQFSRAIIKRNLPYNLFAWRGRSLLNSSVDYSYTLRNIHFFGELALSQFRSPTLVAGLVASVDPKAELSVLIRRMERGYQAFFANAFAENAVVGNENGLYTSVSFRPALKWQLDAYADLYKFPWLKFRVDLPGSGADYFLQVAYRPVKHVNVMARWRSEKKDQNTDDSLMVEKAEKKSFRLGWSVERERALSYECRVDWLRVANGEHREEGILAFVDLQYRFQARAVALQARLAFFETDGWASRLYIFENDLQNNKLSSPFYSRGWRWYINSKVNIKKILQLRQINVLSVGIKIAQTIVPDSEATEPPRNEATILAQSEFRFQVLLGW